MFGHCDIAIHTPFSNVAPPFISIVWIYENCGHRTCVLFCCCCVYIIAAQLIRIYVFGGGWRQCRRQWADETRTNRNLFEHLQYGGVWEYNCGLCPLFVSQYCQSWTTLILALNRSWYFWWQMPCEHVVYQRFGSNESMYYTCKSSSAENIRTKLWTN